VEPLDDEIPPLLPPPDLPKIPEKLSPITVPPPPEFEFAKGDTFSIEPAPVKITPTTVLNEQATQVARPFELSTSAPEAVYTSEESRPIPPKPPVLTNPEEIE
jgi:hypothetical protein